MSFFRRSTDRSYETLVEITPDGVLAGRVLAVTMIVSAIGLIVVSWDDLWRVCNAVSGACVERSAGAMLLTIGSLAAIAWGVGILLRIRRRPVHPDGSSRYALALGALFALGCIFIAGRIPAFTCARGRYDDVLELCLHPPTSSEATSWLLLKKAIVVIGLLGAIVLAIRPRNVRLRALVAVTVWGAGFGWLIVDTMA